MAQRTGGRSRGERLRVLVEPLRAGLSRVCSAEIGRREIGGRHIIFGGKEGGVARDMPTPRDRGSPLDMQDMDMDMVLSSLRARSLNRLPQP